MCASTPIWWWIVLKLVVKRTCTVKIPNHKIFLRRKIWHLNHALRIWKKIQMEKTWICWKIRRNLHYYCMHTMKTENKMGKTKHGSICLFNQTNKKIYVGNQHNSLVFINVPMENVTLLLASKIQYNGSLNTIYRTLLRGYEAMILGILVSQTQIESNELSYRRRDRGIERILKTMLLNPETLPIWIYNVLNTKFGSLFAQEFLMNGWKDGLSLY